MKSMFSSKVGDDILSPKSPKFKELDINFGEDEDDLKRSPFFQEPGPVQDLMKTNSVPVILEMSNKTLDEKILLAPPYRSLKKVRSSIAECTDQDTISHNHYNHHYNHLESSQSHFLLKKNSLNSFNYEYPVLAASLKTVYRELATTFALYLLNIASAVGIVLINKYIYSHFKFPHGIVLTFYHFLLTGLGLQVLAGLKMFAVKRVNILQILPLSASFCSYVVLTNLSLQYNSGTFYQILVAPIISLLQFIFYGIKTEFSLLPPMALMLTGVAIATITELKTSTLGLSIAFSGVFMTAVYQILIGTKQKQLDISAIQLLYYQAPVSSIILFMVIPFLTDLSKVFSFEYSPGLIIAIVASAFCAFLLNLSMYLVLGLSSAVTYNVIGLTKLFLVLTLNYLLFENNYNSPSSAPNNVNLMGVLMAFIGVCSFSYVKFKNIMKTEQISTSSKLN